MRNHLWTGCLLTVVLFNCVNRSQGQTSWGERYINELSSPLETPHGDLWNASKQLVYGFGLPDSGILFYQSSVRVQGDRAFVTDWIIQKHNEIDLDEFAEVLLRKSDVAPTVRARIVTWKGDVVKESADLFSAESKDILDQRWQPNRDQIFQLPITNDVKSGCLLELKIVYEKSVGDDQNFFLRFDLDSQAIVRRVGLIGDPGDLEFACVRDLMKLDKGDGDAKSKWFTLVENSPLDDSKQFSGLDPRYCMPDHIATPFIYLRRPSEWKDVAREVRSEMDRAIGKLEPQTRKLAAGLKPVIKEQSQTDAIEMIAAAVRAQDVRDDRAALLTGVLRQLGYEAYIALVASAERTFAGDLPAASQFSRKIVYVPNGESGHWIDPQGQCMAINVLPQSLQGQRALICDGRTAELTKAPVANSDFKTRSEYRRIVANYSGIGTARIRVIGTGTQAAKIAEETLANEGDEISKDWSIRGKEEFPNCRLVGLQANKISHAATNRFEVSARYATTSMSDIAGHVYLDGVSLLEHLPEFLTDRALAKEYQSDRWSSKSYLDEYGDPADRQSDAFFASPSAFQTKYEIWYPALCTPEIFNSWVKSFGPVTISTSYRRYRTNQTNDIVPEPPQENLNELFRSGPDKFRQDAIGFEGTPLSDSRDKMNVLQVTFTASIDAGRMSAEQVNECRDALREMVEESELAHYIQMDIGDSESGKDQFSRLRAIADGFPSDPGPALAIANQFRKFGLEEEAAQRIGPAREFGPFSVQQTVDSLKLLLPREYVTPALFKTRMQLVSDLAKVDLIDQNSMPTAMFGALLDNEGLFSHDAANIQKALDLLGKADLGEEGELSEELKTLRAFLQLALGKDDLVKQTTETTGVIPVLAAICKNESLRKNTELESDTVELIWEKLAAINRYDLVKRIPALLEGDSVLSLPQNFEGEIDSLDQTDPKSVARHLTLAMLRGDIDTQKSLSVIPEHLPLFQRDRSRVHRLFRTWLPDGIKRRFENDKLFQAIAQSAKIETTAVGSFGYNIKINGFDGRWSRIRVVRTPDDKNFRVVHPYNVDSIAPHLLALLDQGEVASVQDWIDQIFSKMAADIDLDAKFRGSCAAHVVASSEALSPDLLKLICQIMDCANKFGESTDALEENLANSRWLHHEIQMRRILATFYENSKQPVKEFPHQLWLTEASPSNLTYIRRLCNVATAVRKLGKDPDDFYRWADSVYVYMDNEDDPEEVTYLRASISRGTDDQGEEFLILRQGIEQLDSGDTEELKNMLLWWSLVDGVPTREMARRTELCSSLDYSDRIAYQHTYECAVALLKNIHEFDEEIVEKCITETTAEGSPAEVMLGLIAIAFGDNEAGRKHFQYAIEIDNDDDSVGMAKMYLNK